MFWTVSTADALCLLLLALLQGHRLGYLLEGQILPRLLQSRTEVAPCWAWGHLGGCGCPGVLGRDRKLTLSFT